MTRGSTTDAVTAALNSDEFKAKLEDIVKTIVDLALKEYEKAVEDKIEEVKRHCDVQIEEMKKNFEETLKKYQHQIGEMAEQIDNLEQYTRRECLLINGVKKTEANTSAKATKEIVYNVARSMKVDDKIIDRDIARTHWMGDKLVVKFARYEAREHFYENRKSAGKGVFINESLTKKRNNLVYECRKLKKEEKILAVWTNDGVVKIKMLNKANKVIKSLQDIEDLK